MIRGVVIGILILAVIACSGEYENAPLNQATATAIQIEEGEWSPGCFFPIWDCREVTATPIPTATPTPWSKTVYSKERTFAMEQNLVPDDLEQNTRLRMDGIELLNMLPDASASAAFFDPQYRGVLDKLSYGNEGQNRGKKRFAMPQMTD